ncbi:hypothetical protein KAFR_0D03860 [Kazachstania africana CBS 2517]|uniref:Retrograde transport protein Dsl1 C-terminal domain-containing protein n=1 Tax=Kazachstania africana (strain ATCC 22294 / BCRC 22015 / CBS 2517 / CECT 1963 / NBRC 1671 / NRRL Y-8276) TaxID=1071382 RepID=H2AUI4_KAZAF|nr:hypothetical protein KAFR_0D03860 [Kazachstania africana CBS 2517]CCF58034.1 hypothetical protein KAFR_0D03860 [Kazachstania africana CBS 2517]
MEPVLPDRETLISLVEQNLILKNKNTIDDPSLEMNKILEEESKLSEELRDLTKLKTISSLLKEVNVNFELLEFENCYYSLKSLRSKLTENNSVFIKQTYRFQRSTALYIDSLHSKLIDSIHEVITTKFWNITSNTIKFNPKIKIGDDDVQFDYTEFMSFAKSSFFTKDTSSSEFWFLATMELGDYKENVRSKLNDINRNFIEFNNIIGSIKNLIYDDSVNVTYSTQDNILSFQKGESNDYLEKIIEKSQAIVNFLTETFLPNNLYVIVSEVGSLLSTELFKTAKSNASQLLRDRKNPLIDLVRSINSSLIKLSNEIKSNWKYNGSDIDHLLNDEKVYINLLIDKTFDAEIKMLRESFKNKENFTVNAKVPFATAAKYENNQTILPRGKKNEEPSKSTGEDHAEDDWGWDPELDVSSEKGVEIDEDDAWDDHIDLNIDEDDTVNQETNNHDHTSKADVASIGPDVDDGWDDEWDIGENLSSPKKTKAELSINAETLSVEITKLPTLFKKSLQNFLGDCEKIGFNKSDAQYFEYKLNLLQTSFFAIATAHFNKDNWYQLYIDTRQICSENSNLLRLEELATRFLENNIFVREKTAYNLISMQLKELMTNERNPSWESVIEHLLPFIQHEIIEPLTRIGGEESMNEIIKFFNFLYNDCIVRVIQQWDIISEKNSENISELVSLVASNTDVPHLHNIPKYKELRDKFIFIGKFLPLHLKEIMELFYNGDFYLFSTQEIIQWLRLLFADTPIRKNAIDDIYEIREVALEDQ